MNNQTLKGILPINKPQGWTSFDVVNKIKHIIAVRGLKIGHLGTLDPMATGVLLVTIGKATKLFDIMQQKTKTYLATFEFGFETDTLDSTGKQTNQSDVLPTKEQIEAVLPKFVGKIQQIPPKYSAKSVNGKRAYDLARENKDFELKPCKVEIKSLKLIDYFNNVLTLQIVCGSGTYIRALGRDIAYSLGSFATMISLVRTNIDEFSIEKCKEIGQIDSQNVLQNIVKIKSVLSLPEINFDEKQTAKILNGQTLNVNKNNGLYLLNDAIDTIAIVEINDFKAKMSIFLA